MSAQLHPHPLLLLRLGEADEAGVLVVVLVVVLVGGGTVERVLKAGAGLVDLVFELREHEYVAITLFCLT